MRAQLVQIFGRDLKIMGKSAARMVEPIQVTAEWDPEAEVWVAVSDQVPGLVAEAASMNELIPVLEELIPQLLRDNNAPAAAAPKVDYHVNAHIKRELVVAAAAA
jgi:Domain of unknown function (DUF1902)